MIGDSFKRFRQEYELTQKKVATTPNIYKQAYQRYEYGTREPAYKQLVALADAYNISTDYFLGRSNNSACLQ